MAKTKGCAVKKQYSDEQRAEWAAEREVKLAEAHEQIQQQVMALVESPDFDAKLKAFFRFHARFHTYSFQNSLWLMFQAAVKGVYATQFASYGDWQKLGRQVRKGEKAGYAVLAPMIVQDKESKERGDKPVKTRLIGFKVVGTFGKEQTDPIPGAEKPEPTLIETLKGDGDLRLREALEGYARGEGMSVMYGDDGGKHHGYWQRGTRKIYVKQQDGAQMVKTLTHEIAHDQDEELDDGGRIANEAVAEGAAFIVCQHFGFDTGSYSFGYIASWVKQAENPEALMKQVMNRTVKIARKIIDGVEHQLSYQSELNMEAESELVAA